MARILGIELAADYGAGPAIKEAVGDLRDFQLATDKASASVTKLAGQRANLQQLAMAYQDVADSAVKGSDEQQIALKKVSDAQASLARQIKVTADESVASTDKMAASSDAVGRLGSSATKTTGLISKLGNSMALWLGAPALGYGIDTAIKSAQKYDAALEMIHTQAGATQSEVTKMSASLLAMASSVGTSAQTLSDGLFHIESTGVRGTQALNTLKIAAEGARIGNSDLEDTTNALNATVLSGIRGSEDYTQAMGMLNATVGAGDMHMQDLADAMGTGLPSKAAVYGASLRDVSAALATLGDNNIRGAHAGTLMASALRLMAAPSKVAADALTKIGIGATELGDDIRSKGLVAALEDLKSHMDALGLSASQQAEELTRAFGGKQSGAILILMDQLDRLKQKVAAVDAGSHSFASDWAAYQKTSQFATQQFTASLDTLRIEIGQELLPEFTAATKSLSAWVDKENQSGAITRDTKTAVADLVSILKTAGTIIHDVDDITGSFKDTLEILLGLKVISVLGGWTTSIGGVGSASVVAEGEVATLRSSLFGLAGIGIISIPIVLSVTEKDFSGKTSKGLLGVIETAGGIGPTIAGDIYRSITGGSGSAPPKGTVNLGNADAALPARATNLGLSDAALPTAGNRVTNSQISQMLTAAGFDAQAVMGVASNEGLSGGIGDNGHAFGPFQLNNAGGVITGMFPGWTNAQIQAWAWSPQGVQWAINQAAKSGSGKGLSGSAAVSAWVSDFERPKNPSGDINAGLKALGISGTGGITNGPGNSAFQSTLTGGSGKTKKPAIVSGTSEIPEAVKQAIAKAQDEIGSTSGGTALDWVNKEKDALLAAKKALQADLDKQTGKQAAATQTEIDALDKQLGHLPTISGSKLLPQSLLDEITKFKNDAVDSTGAQAEKYLKDERVELESAVSKLNAELKGASTAQAAAIKKELDTINTQIAAVNKQITDNLKAQAQAVKTSAASSISSAKSSIESAFSAIAQDARSAFEQQTQDYIDNTLGPEYYQGTNNPLETQLAGMQAQDTVDSLNASLVSAQTQLGTDQGSGADAATLAADQAAIDSANRAIAENNLSIQATALRAKEDTDYANAVATENTARALEEQHMTDALSALAKGVESGAIGLDGPNGLNSVLGDFGVTLDSLSTDDLGSLSDASVALAKVFAAEAVALSKLGDNKDAKAAAATAQTILNGMPSGSSSGGATVGLGGRLAPALASGTPRVLSDGFAYLHSGEAVIPASVIRGGAGVGAAGGGTITITVQVSAPHVTDTRGLEALLKGPGVREAVATAVIQASRAGHIRSSDIL